MYPILQYSPEPSVDYLEFMDTPRDFPIRYEAEMKCGDYSAVACDELYTNPHIPLVFSTPKWRGANSFILFFIE